MSQVFAPDDPKRKKYSNWRDAAYDKPVNNFTHWRTDPASKPYDPYSVFKLMTKARKQNNHGRTIN